MLSVKEGMRIYRTSYLSVLLPLSFLRCLPFQVQVQNIIHIHDARTRDAAAAADDEADTKCWACLFNSYYDPFPAATTAAAAAQLNGFT